MDADKLVTKSGDPAISANQRLYLNGVHRTVGLPQQVALWQTIKASDGEKGGPSQRDGKGNPYLPMQAALWPTPNVRDHHAQGLSHNTAARSSSLATMAARNNTLWPTPDVPNGGRSVPDSQMATGTTPTGRKVQKPLARTAELWPSPIASEVRQGFQDRSRKKKGKQESLTTRTVLWPTPRTITGGAESAARKKELGRMESGGGDLQATARNWPTPRAEEKCQHNSRDNGVALSRAVTTWPTPSTRDYRTPNSQESQERRNADSKRGQQLSNFVSHNCSLPVPTNSTDGKKCSKSTMHLPRLNPLFVCWLMGWPRIAPGGFGFTETEWCRFRQPMRSALYGLLCGSTDERPHP